MVSLTHSGSAALINLLTFFFIQVAFCNISLVDDGEHEPNENFKVLLKEAQGSLWYGAKVGENDEVLVTITNTEDGKKSILIDFMRHNEAIS